MATINGLTAERMLAIEAASVVDGTVVGDNLILTKHDGSTIDAGNVRGAIGLGVEELNDYLNLVDPPGVPKPYTLSNVAPTGHGLCDAVVEYDGATYPVLAAAYGTGPGCVNGAAAAGKFRLPDLRRKTLIGRDAAVAPYQNLHATGGSKDSIVVTHAHPGSSGTQVAHGHTADQPGHNHGGSTTGAGAHTHSVDGGDFGDRIVISYGSNTSQDLALEGAGYDVLYTHIDGVGDHAHGIPTDDPAISIGTAQPAVSVTVASNGVSGTDANLPPYRIVNYIMRLV